MAKNPIEKILDQDPDLKEQMEEIYGKSDEDQLRESRIVGGLPIFIEEFPWQVNLQYKAGSKFLDYCGGSIIHPKWILSAAHCYHMIDSDGEPFNFIPSRILAGASKSYQDELDFIKYTTDQDCSLLELLLGLRN